jgi:hypothetical protein
MAPKNPKAPQSRKDASARKAPKVQRTEEERKERARVLARARTTARRATYANITKPLTACAPKADKNGEMHARVKNPKTGRCMRATAVLKATGVCQSKTRITKSGKTMVVEYIKNPDHGSLKGARMCIKAGGKAAKTPRFPNTSIGGQKACDPYTQVWQVKERMVVNPIDGKFPTTGIKKWLDAKKTKLNPKYAQFAVVKKVGQCVLAKGAEKKCQRGEMLAKSTATRAGKDGILKTHATFRCVKTLPKGHTKVADGTLPPRHRLPSGLKHHDLRENRKIDGRIAAAVAKKDLHAAHVAAGTKINLAGKKCPRGYMISKTNKTKCEANPTAHMTVAEKARHVAKKKALAPFTKKQMAEMRKNEAAERRLQANIERSKRGIPLNPKKTRKPRKAPAAKAANEPAAKKTPAKKTNAQKKAAKLARVLKGLAP